MFANLRNVENVWLQFRAGIVDENILPTYASRSPVLYQLDASANPAFPTDPFTVAGITGHLGLPAAADPRPDPHRMGSRHPTPIPSFDLDRKPAVDPTEQGRIPDFDFDQTRSA
jgi:hypothetical protein